MDNRQNGGSPKLKILIGIPSFDNPMTNLPKKNGWNSLQPPKLELKSLVPIEWPLLTNILGCSPGHIRQQIWALVQVKNRKFLYFTSWHVTWYEEFYVHFKQLNNNCNVEFHEQGRFDLSFCFLLPLSVIIQTNTNSSYLLILNKQTLLLDFSFNMTALQ